MALLLEDERTLAVLYDDTPGSRAIRLAYVVPEVRHPLVVGLVSCFGKHWALPIGPYLWSGEVATSGPISVGTALFLEGASYDAVSLSAIQMQSHLVNVRLFRVARDLPCLILPDLEVPLRAQRPVAGPCLASLSPYAGPDEGADLLESLSPSLREQLCGLYLDVATGHVPREVLADFLLRQGASASLAQRFYWRRNSQP